MLHIIIFFHRRCRFTTTTTTLCCVNLTMVEFLHNLFVILSVPLVLLELNLHARNQYVISTISVRRASPYCCKTCANSSRITPISKLKSFQELQLIQQFVPKFQNILHVTCLVLDLLNDANVILKLRSLAQVINDST